LSEIIIRRAKKEDCKSMMQLIHELAEYEKAPEEVTVDFNHFVESGFSENPVWWAFVAEVKNEVVGFALYYIRYSTWKGQRLYLEDILVNEPWRGKGIGRLLFSKLLEETKER
jgi:GNAT superfamily N-acetyltransferase